MQRISQSVFGILISLLGLSVIIGWFINNPLLMQISDQYVPMQFNSAIEFFLSGIAITLAQRRPILSGAIGIFIATLAIATLLQDITQMNFGIDEIFLKSNTSVLSENPGRMAPNTALCFIFNGAILVLINFFSKEKIANHVIILLTIITGLMGISSLVGYVFNIEFPYSWGNLTHMAAHTSIGFILIAITIFTIIRHSIIEKGWMLCVIIGALGFVFSLVSWQGLIFQQSKQIKEIIERETLYLKALFTEDLVNRLDSIDAILLLEKNNPREANKSIKKYAEKDGSLLLFATINRPGNPDVLFSDLSASKTNSTLQLCETALLKKKNAQPENLYAVIQGPFVCIKRDDSNLIGVLDMTKVIQSHFNSNLLKNYGFQIYKDNQLYYEKACTGTVFYRKQWEKSSAFNFLNAHWEIKLWPKKSMLNEISSHFPLVFILFGFTLTLSLVLMIRLWQTSKTEAKNAQLIYDITAIASSEEDTKKAMKKCLNLICNVLDWEIGHIYFLSEDQEVSVLTSSHIWYLKSPEKSEDFKMVTEKTIFEKGMSFPGRIWEMESPIWIADIAEDKSFIRINQLHEKNIHAAIGFPIIVNKKLVSVFELFSFETRNPNIKILRLFKIISKQLGRIFERQSSKKQLEKYADDLKSTNNVLDFMAKHDPLTGVANRLEFTEKLKQAMSRADRNKSKVAILAIDLDHFKNVNDTYGHNIGDLVLKETTKRILSCIREYDTLSRLGGDEFVIIIDSLNDIHSIEIICNKLLASLRKEFILNNHSIHISITIGVSIYPIHGSHIIELMHNADVALYKGKNAGKDRFCIFFPN